ncbi:MAG: chromosome segregation protein [Verrucomicrobiales bacterium]|jgi:chromosome segregation protein
MFLKSLEINGFKSFADPTLLEFHPGVTGIVGPNGCGKSNVVDAIRWVLGETSAKALRGGEMADVIFNGTEKRKPLGLAEVVLTLGDTAKALGVEFEEMSVGRRVYRDGKSEYLLNRKPCRLKDINDLFMDTGIGRSSYSVMEQGKIDMLLSSKPEDRRQVFEEAAGITKFKSQKREALRKLDYTEANLVRICDIIEEQRRQMGSLQRQSAKARRYASLLEHVRVLDTHFSHRKFAELTAERSELVVSVESLRKSQEEMQAGIEGGQTDLNDTRQAFQKVEEELGNLRQREIEQQNRIQGAHNRIGFNDERRKELLALIDRNQSDITANQDKLNTQQRDLAYTNESLEAISGQIERQERELGNYVKQTEDIRKEREDIDTSLTENRNSLGAAESLVATLTAQLENGRNQLESSQQRLTQLAEEVSRVQKEHDAKTKEDDALNKDREKHETARENFELELKQLEDSFDTAQRDLAAARVSESNLSRELTEKQTRLETLQQLVASGEGFERGTKEVLKGLDQPDFFTNAVRGVVANFIEVENEFIPAIEASLGHLLQAVVVADATMAQAMLDSLKRGELGQASLIPENLLVQNGGIQMQTTPHGAVGWAIDRVKPEARVEPVVSALLKNVLIVESFESALELRKDYPDVSFATLGGEFLSSEGILTGGVRKGGAASILERQSEIKTLQGVTDELRSNLAGQKKVVMNLDEDVASAKVEVDTHRERLQQIRVTLSTVDGQLALVQREIQQSDSKLESLRWEEDELKERQAASQAKLQELDDSKKASVETIQKLNLSATELGDRGQLVREKETEATSLLNDLKTSLAVEKRAKEALQQQRSPMTSRMQELTDIIRRRKSEIETYNERIENAASESEKLRGEIGEAETDFSGVVDNRKELESQRGIYLSKIEKGEVELVTLRQDVQKVSDQRGKEEIRSTQLELRIENLTETIRERYQLELEVFEPDSHTLLAVITEQRKSHDKTARRRETMAAKGDEEEAGPDAEDESEAPVQNEQSDQSEAEPVELEPAAAEDSEVAEAPEAEAEVDVDVDVETEEPVLEADEEDVTEAELDEIEIPDESQPDWEFVESILGGLRRKLDSMGPVNLDAIAEYDELEERFNMMQQQHDDLVSSKEELLKVIEKINVTTEEMFAETFVKVRENFREMFTELFGKGAQANLVLLDDDDPLESGIEIIAKPPGKKLQSISLLSGGERSMTAVALLFAIYMVKPSPFCVLDELDAPLDEANIERFIRVLDRFIESSQFIIVTHSKRTMSRADVMYGVSMEEFGVSKTLSIRFNDTDKPEQEDVNPWTEDKQIKKAKKKKSPKAKKDGEAELELELAGDEG